MKRLIIISVCAALCSGCHRAKPSVIPPFPGQITTIAGNGTINGSLINGGSALNSSIYPAHIAIDGNGNIYFSYYAEIFKITTAGIINFIAGNGSGGYSGDGGAATAAAIISSGGLCVDKNNNIYFVDSSNIRKINTAGIISTIAGTGAPGYNGDGIAATAAQLNSPVDVAADNSGNIYIADAGNNRIRKIDTAGVITTVAGNGTGGYTGTGGPATAAEIDVNFTITADALGNIYFDNAETVSKINPAGIISNFTGNDHYTFNPVLGDGGPATDVELQIGASPNSYKGDCQIAVDGNNNVYITDAVNQRIRKIDNLGIITTVAGGGYLQTPGVNKGLLNGYGGDGGPATAAELNWPRGVAVSADGVIYIADSYNYRVRKVSK